MGKSIILGILVVALIIVVGMGLSSIFLKPFQRPSQCNDPNVRAVYSCSDGSIRVVSKLIGAGYKIINSDGTEIDCPMVNPENLSEECKKSVDCSENLC